MDQQNIGKWPIKTDCDKTDCDKTDCDTLLMFNDCFVERETFEGKLYGNKIAEYFNLDNGNEYVVRNNR